MGNFKQLLEHDLKTFYNTKEFAEVRMIEHNGKKYKIPVIFDHEEAKERKKSINDKADDLYILDLVIRIKLKDIGYEPRKKTKIYIDQDEYKIRSVSNEYGEIILGLECVDE